MKPVTVKVKGKRGSFTLGAPSPVLLDYQRRRLEGKLSYHHTEVEVVACAVPMLPAEPQPKKVSLPVGTVEELTARLDAVLARQRAARTPSNRGTVKKRAGKLRRALRALGVAAPAACAKP